MGLRAIEILKELNPKEINYKKKVILLAEIIKNPDVGIVCPDNLVKWCIKSNLNIECIHTDRTSWWSVSGKKFR